MHHRAINASTNDGPAVALLIDEAALPALEKALGDQLAVSLDPQLDTIFQAIRTRKHPGRS